jgi:cardiolipin synthase
MLPADIYLPLVGAAQIVFASAVTIHALLRKTDVRSATAWIGFTWFVPVLGPILYVTLGVNRVTRRARKLARRRPRARVPTRTGRTTVELGHLTPLAIASGRITGRPLLPGNALTLLAHGDGAYPQMLQAIRSAQTSVALAGYIFEDDAIGQQFIAALSDAQRRGVSVRVLIDGIGGGYWRTPAYSRLCGLGVPAGLFLHSYLPWRMPFLNLRSHRKVLVIDGTFGFTGGLNISADNLIAGDAPHKIRDTHFAVIGPVVGQIMTVFAEDWHFTTSETLNGPAWFPHMSLHGDMLARTVTSGPDYDLGKIKAIVLCAIGQAREEIRIVTPYFLPDDAITAALALAALRDVKVQIMTPETTDHFFMDWALRACLLPLLESGCDIRFGPGPFDHSKLMTVDGNWSLIGSANWDARSFRLNFEVNLEIYGAELATAINAEIDARLGRKVTTAEINRRPLLVLLRDAAVRLGLPYL